MTQSGHAEAADHSKRLAELGRRLERLSAERAQGVDATVLELLEWAVGFDQRRERFRRFATWDHEEREVFERELKQHRKLDDALWVSR